MKITRINGSGIALVTLLAPLAWGTTYITVTELLPDGRPLLVATSRVVPAGIALLIIGRLVSRWQPRGTEWKPLISIGMFNFAFFFPLLIVAAYLLPGGVAAATGGLQPLLVALVNKVLFRQNPRRLDMAVGIAAAIGVALVVIRRDAGVDPLGVAAAVAANLLFAIGVVLTKRSPVPPNRITATGWQLLISGAVLIPLTIVVEGLPGSLTLPNVGGFAYLSLIGTALAFVLWFSGIPKLPVAGPPLLGLAAPITGAVLGWLALGESFSLLQLAGFVMTIGAVAYGALLREPESSAETSPSSVPLGVPGRECPQPA